MHKHTLALLACLPIALGAAMAFAQGSSAPSAPPAAPAAADATTPPTTPTAVGGDPVAGQQKTQMCAGCHGIEGYRTAFPEVYMVPKIGGQHEAYIVKALQAYRSGERSHPSMRAIASTLSDKDMADLAAYYAKSTLTTASK
jgi:cytochrome c553